MTRTLMPPAFAVLPFIHEQLSAAAQGALTTSEHGCALNLNAWRSRLDELERVSRALPEARCPQDLLDMQFDGWARLQTAAFDYGRNAASAGVSVQGEWVKQVEAGVAQYLQATIIALETVRRGLPPGAGLAAGVAARSARISAAGLQALCEQLGTLYTQLRAQTDQGAAA